MPNRTEALHLKVGRYFRSRRMQQFVEAFNVSSSTRILDLGGSEYYWHWCPVQPTVTIVNFESRDLRTDRFPWVFADGRRLPFNDQSFDIVYCNSVLEHLPDEYSRKAMALEIIRVGRGYCVQTPNRRFPVEAHLLTPGIHALPKSWQIRLARNFTLWGWLQRPGIEEARGFIQNIHLLTAGDLQRLFPEATLKRERFLGITKSLSAYSRH